MKKKRIEASKVFRKTRRRITGGLPIKDYHYGRDNGILLHPGDERSLKAVASQEVSGSDKGEGSSFKKEGVCVLLLKNSSEESKSTEKASRATRRSHPNGRVCVGLSEVV